MSAVLATSSITFAPHPATTTVAKVVHSVAPKPPKLSSKVLTNCYSYVKQQIPALPRTAKLHPNSKPKVGAVAIFWYPPSPMYPQGTPHYAVVKAVKKHSVVIAETNYHHGKYTVRTISLSYSPLKGFWN